VFEAQPAGLLPGPDQLGKARLEDRRLVVAQVPDVDRVKVEADDRVTRAGETGSRYAAKMPETVDADAHQFACSRRDGTDATMSVDLRQVSGLRLPSRKGKRQRIARFTGASLVIKPPDFPCFRVPPVTTPT